MSWSLSASDLRDLARGAALLGTGGGGDPYVGRLLVEQGLGSGGQITMLATDELDDDLFVIPVALMGAPTVMVEKLPSGQETLTALRTLERRLGRSADAIMPIECGGINSMIPLALAAQTGLPVVDADGMGRAFPELQMETFGVYGVSACPMAVSDSDGSTAIVETDDNRRMEWLARGLAVRMGGVAYIAEYPMTGRDVKRTAIAGTISLGRSLGAAIREARAAHRDPFAALTEALKPTIYGDGTILFSGRVTDVSRRTEAGFARGTVVMEAFGTGTQLVIAFQNEHLEARIDGEVRVIVPDLICTLDAETAEPVTTESLRFGQRITVYTIRAPEIMRTPEALDTFGPAAFGLVTT
jgi:uncharacterized protein